MGAVLPWAAMTSLDERVICERYAKRIRAYGMRHLRDEERAHELVQYVLLAVIESLRAGRVSDLERIESYVFGTCRNAVRDMRRGELRQQRIADRAALELPADYEPSFASVDRLRLEGCLQRLGAREQAVVLATFLEDRDAEEIGS